jgi:hypothetical protein
MFSCINFSTVFVLILMQFVPSGMMTSAPLQKTGLCSSLSDRSNIFTYLSTKCGFLHVYELALHNIYVDFFIFK